MLIQSSITEKLPTPALENGHRCWTKSKQGKLFSLVGAVSMSHLWLVLLCYFWSVQANRFTAEVAQAQAGKLLEKEIQSDKAWSATTLASSPPTPQNWHCIKTTLVKEKDNGGQDNTGGTRRQRKVSSAQRWIDSMSSPLTGLFYGNKQGAVIPVQVLQWQILSHSCSHYRLGYHIYIHHPHPLNISLEQGNSWVRAEVGSAQSWCYWYSGWHPDWLYVQKVLLSYMQPLEGPQHQLHSESSWTKKQYWTHSTKRQFNTQQKCNKRIPPTYSIERRKQ